MRHASRFVAWIVIPVLAVVGSTLTVNPILGAEPNEELKAIREVLMKIDQRLENQNTIALQMLDRMKVDFGQLKNDVTALRDDIAKVQRDLNELKGRTGSGASTSYFGGSVPTTPLAPTTATASIKLANTYPTDMTANINGLLYIVPSGHQRIVPVFPGVVTYQVYQTQDYARQTALRPGEVLTLSLYPLQ